MPKFPPNKYQEEIIDWVKNGTGNALIDAKAGSGKTSTLELIAQSYDRKMSLLALFPGILLAFGGYYPFG